MTNPGYQTTSSPVPLGRTGLTVSAVGAGTWQWGDRFYWGYGREYGEEELYQAFFAAVGAGITFFDTAEIYGPCASERMVGRFLRRAAYALGNDASGPEARAQRGLVIATKFFPLPWRLRRASLVRALRGSLRRLGLEQVDLYQVHWPMGPRDVAHWARALADTHDAGLVRAVGVSNYSVSQTRRAHDALASRGVPLASNQVGFSLMNRHAETSGLIDTCRELGVAVIAYGPLGEGLLTGKYGPGSPPPLLRRVRYARRHMPKLASLTGLMQEIGQAQPGRPGPSQVALNWCIAKGTVPIPGIKSAEQARSNAAAMTWRLSPGEVEALDRAAGAC